WLKLDANKQLKDKMTITKGSSKSIEVNGFTKTCDVYDMKIGKDALVAYIRAIWNELKKDPAILNAIAMQSPYMTVEDIIDEIESGLDDLKEVFGDLTATFYVMGENLVRVDFVLPVTGYDTVDLKISIQIGGEKNLLDAFSIDVNVDDEGFVLKWAGHHVPVDGKYDTTLTIHTFDYYDPKPVLAFRMKGGYNTNAAENNLSLVFDIMPDSYDEANLIMNGTLTFDKAKKTVKLDLDDIQFDTDYFSQQFTFSYEYMPMNSIDFTKRDVKMIFSLSESELQIIMDEIIENVSQLFGGMLF
ncbi:MAG: hypothetical protein LBH09_08770, partial [Peptococcaceae bacterium]|nr:hypothetical protein [Peptococcaceae bacterium]